MKIKAICPACKARNTLTSESLSCRRCKEDLTLLYETKANSYQNRLQLVQIILTKSDYAQNFASKARFLVKEY